MPGTVAGVASERDILLLQSTQNAMQLVQVMDDCGVSGKQLHVSALRAPGDGATVVISRENLHNEDQFRQQLGAAFGANVRLLDGLGALSVIGAGINATYANVRRGSECLSSRGITSHGVSTSSFRATWLVERTVLDDAVRLLHEAFIEQSAPKVP